MLTIHPKYITDSDGEKMVIISAKEFKTIVEVLEEFDEIRLYDEAKKKDDGKRMLLDDYLKTRKKNQ